VYQEKTNNISRSDRRMRQCYSSFLLPVTLLFNSFYWRNLTTSKLSGSEVPFVFWQCRPEKPTRPLTLNKERIWCGLIDVMNDVYCMKVAFSQLLRINDTVRHCFLYPSILHTPPFENGQCCIYDCSSQAGSIAMAW
jgi:hypothetical protein